MEEEVRNSKRGGSPKDQPRLLRNLANRYMKIHSSEEAKPFGLYLPSQYYYSGFRWENGEGEFDERFPYLHLALAVDTTLEAAKNYLSNRLSRKTPDTIREEYQRIVRFAINGVHIMASVLELIPIKHLEQFPGEDPSSVDLAAIARRSYPYFVGKLAGHEGGVSRPLVQYHYLPDIIQQSRYEGNRGLLDNWVLDSASHSLPMFKLEERNLGRVLIPQNFNELHHHMIDYLRKEGNYHPEAYCPAVSVKTNEDSLVLPAVWESMIFAAEKWHYVHTIPKMREKMAA